MLRTNTCGELRITDVNQDVVLCGWVQRVRDKGKMVWVDLRDRYGITQLIVEEGPGEPRGDRTVPVRFASSGALCGPQRRRLPGDSGRRRLGDYTRRVRPTPRDTAHPGCLGPGVHPRNLQHSHRGDRARSSTAAARSGTRASATSCARSTRSCA